MKCVWCGIELDEWLISELKYGRKSGVVPQNIVFELTKKAWEKITPSKQLAAFRCTAAVPGQSPAMQQMRADAAAKLVANAPDSITARSSAAATAVLDQSFNLGVSVDSYARSYLRDLRANEGVLFADASSASGSVAVRVAPGQMLTTAAAIAQSHAIAAERKEKEAKTTSRKGVTISGKRSYLTEGLGIVHAQMDYAIDLLVELGDADLSGAIAKLRSLVDRAWHVAVGVCDAKSDEVIHKMRKKKDAEMDAEFSRLRETYESMITEFRRDHGIPSRCAHVMCLPVPRSCCHVNDLLATHAENGLHMCSCRVSSSFALPSAKAWQKHVRQARRVDSNPDNPNPANNPNIPNNSVNNDNNNNQPNNDPKNPSGYDLGRLASLMRLALASQTAHNSPSMSDSEYEDMEDESECDHEYDEEGAEHGYRQQVHSTGAESGDDDHSE